MRLLSWNARGLGDDDKNDTVCTLLNDAKVDIICIQETKLSDHHFQSKEIPTI
jgi:exonuclease III